MKIQKNRLPLEAQSIFDQLDQKQKQEILQSKTISEAIEKLKNTGLQSNFEKDEESEKTVTDVDGSIMRYRSKQLFTEVFEPSDVVYFENIIDKLFVYNLSEIKIDLICKINEMYQKKKCPLQCMVYATHHKEKEFYQQKNWVEMWANVISDYVREHEDSIKSFYHMLTNWERWDRQIYLLLLACSHIGESVELDDILRTRYACSKKETVRLAVINRFLSLDVNEKNERNAFQNFQSIFSILQDSDFLNNSIEREYFTVLKNEIRRCRQEKEKNQKKLEILNEALFKIPGFSGSKRAHIEALFEMPETDGNVVERINAAESPEKAEEIVKNLLNYAETTRNANDLNDFLKNTKDIQKYQKTVQNVLIMRINRNDICTRNVVRYNSAVLRLDNQENQVGQAFLRKRIQIPDISRKEKLQIKYSLSFTNEKCDLEAFIEELLSYSDDDRNSYYYQQNDRDFISEISHNRNSYLSEYLIHCCKKIISKKEGLFSKTLENALINSGYYFKKQQNHYPAELDEMLFQYVDYHPDTDFKPQEDICTPRRVQVVLGILQNLPISSPQCSKKYIQFLTTLRMRYQTHTTIKNKIDNLSKKINEGIIILSSGRK